MLPVSYVLHGASQKPSRFSVHLYSDYIFNDKYISKMCSTPKNFPLIQPIIRKVYETDCVTVSNI